MFILRLLGCLSNQTDPGPLYNRVFPPFVSHQSKSQLEMANTESNTAVITDNKTEEVDKIADVEKTESSADDKINVPSPPPQSKRVWLERLILCIALFFPLFLATLDTSTYPV